MAERTSKVSEILIPWKTLIGQIERKLHNVASKVTGFRIPWKILTRQIDWKLLRSSVEGIRIYDTLKNIDTTN